MEHFLKGGVLWLIGVPFIGIIIAYALGWI